MMKGSIRRNSILLGLFAVLTTTIIAGTYLGTRERIAEEQRKAAEKALLEIVPLHRHNNAMLDDTVAVGAEASLLGLRKDADIYVARQDGVPVAIILPAIARDGYSGDIQLIIGINIDGTVAGVRALAHRETPGLGDKVDLKKSPWILGFNGRSLADPLPEKWTVRKDRGVFDQFTGATITPRAVTAAVKRALDYYAEHRNELLGIEEDDNG
ncbi:MAG: electron transport complex subunit RsxG [Gammaproteobacteria bacterium]|nr:electron transport complex subunit RsxG [Gammaproteobacteria bacterium]